LKTESESELLHDLTPSPLRLTTSNFIFQLNTCGYSPYVTSSLMRRWVCRLQFLRAPASAAILGSQSRETEDHIILSQMRLPQTGGPGPRIYIPQEQGGPVIPRGTGFPFLRLLRLAGLRWRYSNPPPSGCQVQSTPLSARTTHRKHIPSIVACCRPHRKHVSDCELIGPLPALGVVRTT
jgi:hypothetical protein